MGKVIGESARGCSAWISTCPVFSRMRRYPHSKGPWRVILPHPTVYQLCTGSPRMTCPGPPIHWKELRGTLGVDDSRYSALSITAGCRRVKTWTQVMYLARKLGQA